jgi:hypothetical protein
MALPDPVSRKPLHTRKITFEGFVRDDGLFDIDAELVDSKSEAIHMHEKGELPAGGAIHHMRLRVTVDDKLTIRAIQTAMDATPFGYCLNAADPMQKMVGATLGAGWRKTIEGAIGGIEGCTHLRELLFNVATAAYQTVPIHVAKQRQARGEKRDPDAPAPHFLGGCLAWDRAGPVVQRWLPMYYRPPAAK